MHVTCIRTRVIVNEPKRIDRIRPASTVGTRLTREVASRWRPIEQKGEGWPDVQRADDGRQCLPPNATELASLEARDDRLGDPSAPAKLALRQASREPGVPHRGADGSLAKDHENVAVVNGDSHTHPSG